MNTKYLKITIHDNDFTGYAYNLASAIKSMFIWLCWIPRTDGDLEDLKPAIAHIWNGMAMMVNAVIPGGKDFIDYIEKHLDLSIVDFNDIPDKNNYEDLYIPLFNSDEFVIV